MSPAARASNARADPELYRAFLAWRANRQNQAR
jgi:hypothetical protein